MHEAQEEAHLSTGAMVSNLPSSSKKTITAIIYLNSGQTITLDHLIKMDWKKDALSAELTWEYSARSKTRILRIPIENITAITYTWD